MILLVCNYKNELNENIIKKYDFIEPIFLNEQKWNIFAMKLIKYIYQNPKKYNLILHFWTCWAHDSKQIWTIYKIDRTFLFNNEIIENQRFKNWENKFQTIQNSNIVTKFNIGDHWDKLYDFANIFDLETFWVAQAASQISTPIISIKGISDHNDIINNFNKKDEIEFLLNPENKRLKKTILYEKILNNIKIVNNNLQTFLENEFINYYKQNFKQY